MTTDTTQETTMIHAQPPTICPKCFEKIRVSLKAKERIDFMHCPHNDALALLHVVDFKIVTWHMSGPVTAEEAVEHLRGAANIAVRALTPSPSSPPH